jgi:branched-chain amino acid transport system ATP-binding protein
MESKHSRQSEEGQATGASLHVRDLTKRFGGLVAVSSVTFDVPDQSITALIGPNGAGKTTIFNMISGALRSDSGEIILDHSNITATSPPARAALGIARTFQNVQLFRNLNALENVMVSRRLRTEGGLAGALTWPRSSSRNRAHAIAYSLSTLESVGLADSALKRPAELSYGDQRRLELARAVATNPRLLLLDEPTAGMSAREAFRLIEIVMQFAEEGMTVLVVEHNMPVVMTVATKVIVLSFGQLIFTGSPDAARNHPEVIEAYLGRDD